MRSPLLENICKHVAVSKRMLQEGTSVFEILKMVNTSQTTNSLFEMCQYSCPKRKCKPRKRRHVPHSQRSPEYVQHRNSRERRRVEAINDAFMLLRKHVPFLGETDDRESKAGILYGASRYIRVLADILENKPSNSSLCADVNGNTITEHREEIVWKTNVLEDSMDVSQNRMCNHYCKSELPVSTALLLFCFM